MKKLNKKKKKKMKPGQAVLLAGADVCEEIFGQSLGYGTPE